MTDQMNEPNPFAALLDGVPKYGEIHSSDDDPVMFTSDVLAALAAAVLDDLAEAGKVLEALEARCNPYDYDPLARNAADLITALLARIAAQEAVIARRGRMHKALAKRYAEANTRAEAAETALAAERAKTAKLVEAGKRVLDAPFDTMEEHNAVTDLRAAIMEASQ